MVEIEEAVLIEASAPSGDADTVKESFKNAGFDVEVTPARETRSAAGAATWLVQFAITETIEGFFLALGAAAFKFFVLDLVSARSDEKAGKIEISDSESTHVIIHSSISAEAIERLGELDWSELRGGYIVWRADQETWEDHFA